MNKFDNAVCYICDKHINPFNNHKTDDNNPENFGVFKCGFEDFETAHYECIEEKENR